MDFKTQTSQQPQAQPVTEPQVRQAPPSRAPQYGPAGSGGSGRKLLAVVISVLVLIALVAAMFMLWHSNQKTTTSGVETDKYQALFMTNGQVYFGRLSNLDDDRYTVLTDVYYLQVQQDVQPAADPKATAEQPQVSLTKLGNELHGPTDKMHIARDQILFWENLKDDSSVVKAIKDYKAKQ